MTSLGQSLKGLQDSTRGSTQCNVMDFSKEGEMGKKGKACQSHVHHAEAGHNPFRRGSMCPRIPLVRITSGNLFTLSAKCL